jgi:hypothetical protein
VNEWEYKTCFMEFAPNKPKEPYAGHTQQVLTDAQLTLFGSEGWELVSVVRLTIAGPSSPEWTWGIQYIFKRPKR